MAYKKKERQKKFADLTNVLAQSKDTDNSTYQVIKRIIERLDQNLAIINENVAGIGDNENLLKNVAPKNATYLTVDDETTNLPRSFQLLAGPGISFNDSVPNQRTITTLGGYYDAPLTDGDVDETNLIFASGECIIVQVPVLT